MSEQPSLFDVEPRYCIDTNVIVSFLHQADDEPYGSDVFAPQWAVFERLINNGTIIAPVQVQVELGRWATKNPAIHRWMTDRRGMFRPPSTEQLAVAKKVVNRFPGYGRDMHYMGDLMVISLAAAHELTVITLEHGNGPAPSRTRPKIPFTCAEIGVGCTTVAGFLRREQSPVPVAQQGSADGTG